MRRHQSILIAALAACFFSAPVLHAEDKPLPRRAHVGMMIAPTKDGKPGALIAGVSPNSPSQLSGIIAGDVVTKIGAKPVATADDLTTYIRNSEKGGDVPLEIIRDGKSEKITLAMKELPKESHPGLVTQYGYVTVDGARLRMILVKPEGKGPFPAVFFVQGLPCSSIESPISTQHPYWQFTDALAKKGFLVLRVEKSGVGDSEGPPCGSIDFDTELKGYSAALDSLFQNPDADAARIYLFGHSMGGLQAPLLARGRALQGVAVFGTGVSSWFQYLLRIQATQGKLAGAAWADIARSIRDEEAFQSQVLIQGKTGAEIQKAHPEMEKFMEASGYTKEQMMGRSYAFFKQLYDINQAEAWEEVTAPVLAMHGSADFVSYEDEHTTLVDVITSTRGTAKYVSVPNTDHSFFEMPTEEASFLSMQGKDKKPPHFNPAVVDTFVKWTRGEL